MSIYQTIKKYLLLLSVFFVAVTLSHIIFLYLSEGSVQTPEEGGTITIGLIGTPPNINPALYGTDPMGDYMLHFLSRSLLRYNVEKKEMEGDLANCNLGKNFSEIKCYIKNDATWSNGNPVTKEDIIATYSLFKNTEVNKWAKKLLENIDITDAWGYIQFSGKADVLVLDILLYPIIEKNVVENIKKSTFSITENPTSGPYVFEKREMDDRMKGEKISFIRNSKNTADGIYIQKYVFRFFHDKSELIASKDSLNIVYPDESIDSLPSPRFENYTFLLPEYISLFLNQEKIVPELRSFLLGSLEKTTFQSLNKETGKLLHNPFFTDVVILPKEMDAIKLEWIMKSLSFYKKGALLAELTKKWSETVPTSVVSGVNAYFTTPNKPYFVTQEQDFLISWNVPEGVTGVYINDYRLKTFVSGAKKFYFRAKTDIGTMKMGANSYALAFEVGGKKISKETINIYLAQTPEEATLKETEYASKMVNEKTNVASDEKKKDEEKKVLLSKIEPLDEKFFYDKNFKKFSLELAYTKQAPYMEALTKELADRWISFGIDIHTTALGNDDLQSIISKGEKKYSMILTGINLGLFDYNIFPFFHSGQAEKWFNFSKVKNVALDILLEKLKSSQLNSESLKFIESQILEILRKENIVATLYAPYNTYFIDKNIKQIHEADVLPYSSSLYDIGEHMYIKEARIIKFENKSISGFIQWFKSYVPTSFLL